MVISISTLPQLTTSLSNIGVKNLRETELDEVNMFSNLTLKLPISSTKPTSSAQLNLGVTFICKFPSFSLLIKALNTFSITPELFGYKTPENYDCGFIANISNYRGLKDSLYICTHSYYGSKKCAKEASFELQNKGVGNYVRFTKEFVKNQLYSIR